MKSPEWKFVELDSYEGDTWQYKSCGLSNIYLAGGFTRHKTRYGDGVSVVNVEGLHRAIGEWIICSEASLSGEQIRFLRKEMKLTQEGLAELVKLSAQQVARWEKGEFEIPGSADILVRALYKQYIGKQPNLKKLSELLHQERTRSRQGIVFEPAGLCAA